MKSKWFPEITTQANSAVYVLVGTKLDLRDGVPEDMKVATVPPPASSGTDFVTTEEGQALAAQVGAAVYMECSALTQQALKDVFDTTIKNVLSPKTAGGAGGCCTVQ